MSKTDFNDFPLKPGHEQRVAAPPFGPCVYVLERNDGCVYGVWTSRADAVAARTTYFRHTAKPEWFDVRYVPVGSLRIGDIRVINDA